MTTAVPAALRRVFSIYDDAPYRRLGAGVAYVAMLVLIGLESPAALAPLTLLIWANASRLAVALSGIIDRWPWLVVAVPLAAFIARMVSDPPAAGDDLLRHIASAFWPGGYADMFVHTTLPPAPLYQWFDRVVGGLALAFGARAAMWIVQGLALLGFSVAVVRASLAVLGARPDRWLWAALGWALLLELTASRISLGRPEMFMTIWTIAAVGVRSRVGVVAWAGCGVALGAGYWLAPIYFSAALLLRQSWRARILVGLSLGAGWLIVWGAMAGTQLPAALWWTLDAVRHRIEGVSISENSSIWAAFTRPAFLLLVSACVWAMTRPRNQWLFLALALFFASSGQIRYLAIVAPLLLLFALAALDGMPIAWPAGARAGACAMLLVVALDAARLVPSMSGHPFLKLPDGAVALADNLPWANALLFENPGRIRAAPGFELGASDPEVQRLIVDMGKGRLDCARLQRLGFTHLLEHRLRGDSPPCLRLVRLQSDWRLWEVTGP